MTAVNLKIPTVCPVDYLKSGIGVQFTKQTNSFESAELWYRAGVSSQGLCGGEQL